MANNDFILEKDDVSASRLKHFNFIDPGPLPEDLAFVPGFANDLADETMAHSHSPNRTLAFAGALAMLAHLSGRTFADISGNWMEPRRKL